MDLNKLNDLFSQALKIKDDANRVTKEEYSKLSISEREKLSERIGWAHQTHNQVSEKILGLLSDLNPDDIIKYYTEVGDALKPFFGTRMYAYFNEIYIPYMKKGVEDDNSGCHLFIGKLQEYLPPQEFADIVSIALGSKHIRTLETAVMAVKVYQLQHLLPRVIPLQHHEAYIVSSAARDVIKAMQI